MTTTPATTATPRALRELWRAAGSVACGHCAVPPGQPCETRGGREGYHLARFARATKTGLITDEGIAAALMAAGPVFTPASVIPGGAS
jgi:hypothetical protein